MYIALTLDRFNADSLIQDHPLDGREEITHAVIEVAKSYLRPQIVKSIRDIKFSMVNINTFKFSFNFIKFIFNFGVNCQTSMAGW